MFLLAAAAALGPLSTDAYVPGLPVIAADLQAGPAVVQFSVMACLLALSAGQVIAGPWSDRVGRRPVLLSGVGLFVLGSVAAALSPGGGVFVASLAGVGLGGACSLVAVYAVVRDGERGDRTAAAFSTLLLVAGSTPVFAPLVGAGVLTVVGWRAVFALMGVLGAVVLVALAARTPRTRPPETRVGVGVLHAYGRVLRDRTFLGYLGANALVFGVMFVYITAGPFVLQDGYGISALQFGVVFAVNAVGLVAAAQVSGRVARAVSPRAFVVLGACAALVGSTVVTVAAAQDRGVWLVLVGLFVAVSAVGLVLPQATALALHDHGDVAGTAAAAFGAAQYAAAAVAAAVAGALTDHDGTALGLMMMGFAAAALVVTASTSALTPVHREDDDH